MNDAEHDLKLRMKYSAILKAEAVILPSYSVKCSHRSWGRHRLSDIALLAWAVASVILIYSRTLIIGVKHSFGAVSQHILHKILYVWMPWKWTIFRYASAAGPIRERLKFTLPHTCCCLFLCFRHILPAEARLCHKSWAKAVVWGTHQTITWTTARQGRWGLNWCSQQQKTFFKKQKLERTWLFWKLF